MASNRNILLGKNDVVKIGDLGLSKITQSSFRAYSLAGTREYMSPEMYKCGFDENQKNLDSTPWHSHKTDIW